MVQRVYQRGANVNIRGQPTILVAGAAASSRPDGFEALEALAARSAAPSRRTRAVVDSRLVLVLGPYRQWQYGLAQLYWPAGIPADPSQGGALRAPRTSCRQQGLPPPISSPPTSASSSTEQDRPKLTESVKREGLVGVGLSQSFPPPPVDSAAEFVPDRRLTLMTTASRSAWRIVGGGPAGHGLRHPPCICSRRPRSDGEALEVPVAVIEKACVAVAHQPHLGGVMNPSSASHAAARGRLLAALGQSSARLST